MVSTDEQLERLKEFKEKYQYFNFPTAWDVNEAYDLIEVLLERLKWAEKCAELCATDENCCNIPELGENDISPYYLWRKAAGKE